jgi:prepilin peptidase CpaA
MVALLTDARIIPIGGLGLLGILFALAVWNDVKSYRIPNALVYSGAAMALAVHTFLPAGLGLAGAVPGGIGFFPALGGLAVGLVALLPFYLLRAAGAGDVKLMAMTGAFLGPVDAIGAVILTGIAGAVLAAAFAFRARAVQRMASNLRLIGYSLLARMVAVEGPSFDPQRDTAAKVPYSIAIAAGTLAWIALRYWR